MTSIRVWLPLCLLLLSGAASAAPEVGTVTLIEGSARLLRGATWYKLVPGIPVEEGDIVTGDERAQVQVEFISGSLASLAGAGSVYLMPASGTIPQVLAMPAGWLKVAAKAPGLRVRTARFDAQSVDGILVVRAEAGAADVFVETGGARLVDVTPAGGDGAAREAKRGEYWARTGPGDYSTVPRAPKPFVDAMPRHFADPLPVLAARMKSMPALVVDHEVTYAEAEPWLAGRDKAVFEKRFASRLRDPAFRKAAEADIARHPAWDRQLHPEKYAPKAAPAK